MDSQKIIGMVVGLLLLGILLPIGLADLELFTSTNTTVETLVTTVIPVMAIIAIVMMFLPKRNDD